MGELKPTTARPKRRQTVCLWLSGLQILAMIARSESVSRNPRRASHHETAAAAPGSLIGPAPGPAIASQSGFQRSHSESYDRNANQLEQESNVIKASDEVTKSVLGQVEGPMYARTPSSADVLWPPGSAPEGALLQASFASAEGAPDPPLQVRL